MFYCPKCNSTLSLEEVQSKRCTHCKETWLEELSDQSTSSSSGPVHTLMASGFEQSHQTHPDKESLEAIHSFEGKSSASETSNPFVPSADSSATEPDATEPDLEEGSHQPSSLGTDLKSDSTHADSMSTTYWHDLSDKTAKPTATLQASSSGASREFTAKTPQRTLKSSDDSGVSDADYEIISYAAEGSMGKVFVACQNSIQRIVAIKQLKEELAVDEKSRGKFLAEAAVTGELDHPNIVPVHDLGVSQDGKLFYSMKMINGQSWKVQRTQKSRSENLEILLRVADAVAYAHSKNIIHRDLKPENVMIGSFGEVLLTDWGIAIYLDKDKDFELAGTPAYMAPEMIVGPPEALGKCSDIYLLGAILFELVVGRAPHHFSDNLQEVIAHVVANDIIEVDQQDELLTIAKRSMATRPHDRYATVEQFQDALRDYQKHTESLAVLGRAEAELAEALQSKQPESFSRALFGFQNAIEIWSGNTRAYAGLREAKLAYAQQSLENENYELGISLLDPDDDRDQPLFARLTKGKVERDQRTRRLRTAKRSAAGLLAALLLVLVGASIKFQQDKAQLTKANVTINETNRELNGANETLADQVSKINEQNEALEGKEKTLSEQNAELSSLTTSLQTTVDALGKANDKKQENYDLAVSRQQEALQGQFISEIALIKARIADNEATRPQSQLASLKKTELLGSYCDWGWDRLNYLCHPDTKSLNPGEGAPAVYAVTASPDGKLIAAATFRDGNSTVQLWNANSEGAMETAQTITIPGIHVKSLAFSADQQRLAVGGSPASKSVDDPVVVVLNISPQALTIEWLISTGDYWKTSGDKVNARVGYVNSVDFHSGNSEWLLAAGNAPNVIIFQREDAGVWKSVEELPHWGRFLDAHFASDGSAVVTVDQTKDPKKQGVHVWPIEEGKVKKREKKHYIGEFNAAIFSPTDTAIVACAGNDGDIHLWSWNGDTHRDAKPVILAGHSRPVRSIAFSSSGGKLASGSDDRLIRIWEQGRTRKSTSAMPGEGSIDWIRSARLPVLRGHNESVISCQFAGDQTLLSLDSPGEGAARTRLWNLDAYYDELIVWHNRDEIPCTNASFSTDGKTLVTVGKDGYARLWQGPYSEETGKEIALESPIYVGHPKESRSHFMIAPIKLPGETGMAIATLSSREPTKRQIDTKDASLCLWDTKNGLHLFRQQTERANYMATSLRKPIALLGRSLKKSRIEFWEFGRQEAFTCRLISSRAEKATTAAFHPLAQHVFLGMKNFHGLLLSNIDSAQDQANETRFKAMPENMTTANFTANGKWLLTTQEGTNRLLVSEAMTGERKKQEDEALLTGFPFHVDVANGSNAERALVVSHPDNASIGDKASKITLVRTQNGSLTNLVELTGPYIHAALSPSGQRVLSIKKTNGNAVEIMDWEPDNGRLESHVNSKEIARTKPRGLQFLDSRRLLTYGKNLRGRQAAHVWNLDQNVELARMTSGSGVLAVRFSQDRQRLITVCRNGVVYVWNISNPQQPVLERQSFAQGLLYANQAAISHDAQWAVLVGTLGRSAVINIGNGQVKMVRHEKAFALAADCSQHDVAILFSDGHIWTRRGDSAATWISGHSPTKAKLVRLSADGNALAARVGKHLHLWRRDDQDNWQGPLVSGVRNTQDTAICFSKSNLRLLSGDEVGRISIWQIPWSASSDASPLQNNNLRELFSWKGDAKNNSILALSFSVDGKHLVSTSASGSATIWPSLPGATEAVAAQETAQRTFP